MFKPETLFVSPKVYKSVFLMVKQFEIHDKICNITRLLFNATGLPLIQAGGFLLHGPPQTGKTEVCKQVSISLDKIYPEVKIAIVDATSIADSKFGESESRIKSLFNPAGMGDCKKIIVIDDIDCLFFGREHSTSESWHVTLNSILFHCLDDLDKKNMLFLATSNKIEYIDNALKTRLMLLEFPTPSMEELRFYIDTLMKSFENIPENMIRRVKKSILSKIKVGETGYRDIQFWTVEMLAEIIDTG